MLDANFGIGCFRSDNLQVFGNIKSNSSDFEVHEIDVDGNIAGTYKKTKGNKKAKIESAGGIVQSTLQINNKEISQESQELNSIWLKVLEDPLTHLKGVVGEINFHDLSNIDIQNLQTVTLGIFNDKLTRSTIHECVRYLFPHVVTQTDRKENNDVEMTCMVDKLWCKLFSVLKQNKEMTDGFFQFLYCRNIWSHHHTENNNSSYSIHTDIDFDKSARRAIHHCIGENFGKLLESKTMEKNGKNFITIRFKEKKLSQKRKRGDINNCVIVTLYKDNFELLTVLQKLAIALGVHLSNIKYAGIKDKRAVTFQYISIFGVSLKKINEIASNEYSNWNISQPIGNKPNIQLGDLTGNVFKIIIRNIEQALPNSLCVTNTVEQSLRNVTEYGFINYFGQQRFGDDRTSAKIGLLLLKEDYIGAVNLLLKPCPHGNKIDEDDLVKKSKTYFTEQNDIKGALKLMPHHKIRERLVLQALNRYSYTSEGSLKAFMNIPYAMRLFFIHSYCSLIWNKVVSKRITKYGFDVLPGDLVRGKVQGNVELISEDDIKDQLFKLEDIVLPLPGSSVVLPNNITKQMYEDLLDIDSIVYANFRMRKMGFNVPGAYRSIVVKPSDMKSSWIEQIAGEGSKDRSIVVKPNDMKSSWIEQVAGEGSKDVSEQTNVLCLEFELPSSSYATMMVREVLHAV